MALDIPGGGTPPPEQPDSGTPIGDAQARGPMPARFGNRGTPLVLEPPVTEAAPPAPRFGNRGTPITAPPVRPADAAPAGAPPDPNEGGFFSTLGKAGLKGAVHATQAVAEAPSAFRERPVHKDEGYVGKQLERKIGEGWRDPDWWAAQIGYGFGHSYPSVALATVGGVGGAAAGSAVAPGPGTIVGGALGAGAGMGLGSMIQEIAPAYQRARAEGLDHEKAVDRALMDTGIAGAFGAAMGAVPFASTFGRTVAGEMRKPISEALLQVFGYQPAIGAGQQVLTAIAEGKPVDAEDLVQGYALNAGQGAALVGAHHAATGARSAFKGKGTPLEPTPAGTAPEGPPAGTAPSMTQPESAMPPAAQANAAVLDAIARGERPGRAAQVGAMVDDLFPGQVPAAAPRPEPPPAPAAPSESTPMALAREALRTAGIDDATIDAMTPSERYEAARNRAVGPEALDEIRRRGAVSETTPEPAADVRAQIASMLDPETTKDAVFLARGTHARIPDDLPDSVMVMRRPEGTLLTTNRDKAEIFRAGDLNDDVLATLLGYPQPKADVVARAEQGEQPTVVQARDAEGNVVAEAATSRDRAPETAAALKPQAPEGGEVVAVPPEEALSRREDLVAKEAAAREAEEAAAHDAAARAADPDPTTAQVEAGNAKLGHMRFQGIPLAVETERGGTRYDRKTAPPRWTVEDFPAHYGYFKNTRGADGDPIDVFLGPKPRSDKVFVIDQIAPTTGLFDEHKVMAGFGDAAEALDAYRRAFTDGRADQRIGAVTEIGVPALKAWLEHGDHKRPFAAAQGDEHVAPRVEDAVPQPRAPEPAPEAPKAAGDAAVRFEDAMREGPVELPGTDGHTIEVREGTRSHDTPTWTVIVRDPKGDLLTRTEPPRGTSWTEDEAIDYAFSKLADYAEVTKADAALRAPAAAPEPAAPTTFDEAIRQGPVQMPDGREFEIRQVERGPADRPNPTWVVIEREGGMAVTSGPGPLEAWSQDYAAGRAAEHAGIDLPPAPEARTVDQPPAGAGESEAERGLQGPVPGSDARAGAEDVPGAGAERPDGSARPGEGDRGAQHARGPAGERAEAAERSGAESGSAGESRGDRAGDADRVPDAGERAEPGAGERPAGDARDRGEQEPRVVERPTDEVARAVEEQRAAEVPPDSPEAKAPDAHVKGTNFEIKPGELEEGRSARVKSQDNLSAIELANKLVTEDRPATRAEQAVLAKYVGWGGLSGAFENSHGAFGKGFETIGARLKEILTPEEYETARRSTQYAHYTAEPVVRAMWQAVRDMGFKGGQVFEPGMGIGHFVGMMPGDLAKLSRYEGIELDHLTARIAKLLYPESGVRQADFTRTPLPENAFDLVIGNPPFADVTIKSDPKYAVHNMLLHDYFFAKSLDAVRPGGLLGFVTSAGTMNKMDPSAREYLARRAEFVGGARLPDTAFKKNAGTQVTTDVLFFRKRAAPIDLKGETPAWAQTVVRTLPNRLGEMIEGRVNRYFSDHPQQVLGEEGFFDKLYKDRYGVRGREDQDLGPELQAALDRLPKDVLEAAPTETQRAEMDFASGEKKDGSFYIQDGRLMQYDAGAGTEVKRRGAGVEGGKTAAEIERIRNMVPVRDALREVFKHDLADDGPAGAKARAELNQHYDAFVAKHGPINKAEFQYRRPNVVQQETARAEAREAARERGAIFDEGSFDPGRLIEAGKSWQEIARARQAARDMAARESRPFDEGTFNPADMNDVTIEKRPNIDPFMDDPESYRLRSVEDYNDATGEARKKKIFTESLVSREPEPKLASANDGVLWSLNKFGRLDLDSIAKELGADRDTVIRELGDAVYKTPGTADAYETRDAYLSGDVVDKLAAARQAAETDPEVRRNVEALEAVQPRPLAPSEIAMTLGMPWIPGGVIEAFAADHLLLGKPRIRHSKAIGGWSVDISRAGDAPGMAQWSTKDRPSNRLLEDALNRTPPRIYREGRNVDGGKTSEFDPVATQAAQDKVEAMKQAFDDWIGTDPVRGDALAQAYNDLFNRVVMRQFDGSYLTTPGVSSDWRWRPHQTRVVARIVQVGDTYMAHAVGAGKTSAMIGAGMEMKRLGLVNKPMYAVPNHMLGQFAKEFYEQYPTARIVVADERRFHTGRRKQFIANVAQDDIDAVIITHSALGKIPISDEFQDKMIQREMALLDTALADLDKHQDRITVKRIEKQKERLEQRLSKAKEGKDKVLTFEEMGVDFVFVDEAHEFRKLSFGTKQGNLKGIDPDGSDKAWDLYTKLSYLDERRPGRSHVLASGTPVVNTMGELYTLSRYMQPNELARRGLSHFDSWASTFGDVKSALEPNAAGGYQPVTRFSQFVNIPELYKMVGSVMDVVTPSQLEQYVVRPKLAGGARQMHLAPKSDALESYQQHLAQRIADIKARKGPPKPGDDIILAVINDGRHAAIDMRFVDPMHEPAPGEPSKLDMLVENAHRIWQETTEQRFYDPKDNYKTEISRGPASQMIFSNLGIGDAKGVGSRGFSGYQYMKNKLIELGVPAREIAFIKDYGSHIARQKLFNDVNEGKIRILIGSTQKMGTGVNAQKRLAAIHNLDPLWFPADDEQRVGRGVRQGNLNPEIGIHDYSTKGTYDSTMWQMMGRKARFIEQFFRGDPELRHMEDLGEASAYEQAAAISTSDERVIRLTELKHELDKADRRARAHDSEQFSMRRQLEAAQSNVEAYKNRIASIGQDLAERRDTRGDAFEMTVEGKTYTKRKDAGDALAKTYNKIYAGMKKDSELEIGSIGGFTLTLRKTAYDRPDFGLLFNGDRRSSLGGTDGKAEGTIQSAEAKIAGLESDRMYFEKRQHENEVSLESYRSQVGKKFLGGERIKELKSEIAEIERQLSPPKEDETKPTAPPAEGERPEGVYTSEAPEGWRSVEGGGDRAEPGPFRSTRDEFEKASGDRPVEHAARDYVLEQGKATGNEYLAAVDSRGNLVDVGTSDYRTAARFSPDMKARLSNPAESLTVHHNHPGGAALSDADLQTLAHPGMGWIVAHSADGAMSAARLTPAGRQRLQAVGMEGFASGLRRMTSAAENAIEKHVWPTILAGEASRETAGLVHNDLINRAFQHAGLIEYVSSRDVERLVGADVVRRAVEDGAHAAREIARAFGHDLPPQLGDRDVRLHRSTVALRPEDGMARLAGLGGEDAAAGRRAGAERDGTRQGDPGEAGARDLGPDGVEAPRGRYATADEIRNTERQRQERSAARARLMKAPLRALMDTAPMRALTGGETFRGLSESTRAVRDNLLMKVLPMAVGSDRARAIAKKFANSERSYQFRMSQLDRMLERLYTREERELMGDALDEQSAMDQLARRDPMAMNDFEGQGLARLTPDQRATVEMLDALGRQNWQRMGEVGLVSAEEGLPHWMPRYFVRIAGGGDVTPLGRAEVVTALDPVGTNVSTAGPRRRKYLFREETEAAGKTRLGDDVELVSDIRALVYGLNRNERAIASKTLIDAVRRTSNEAGVEAVIDHAARGYKTIDHPAFTVRGPIIDRDPNGRPMIDEAGRVMVKRDINTGEPVIASQRLWVADEFEGPLRAVLNSPPGALYKAVMHLKAGVMGMVMISPMIHNMVEYGRAFPLMPGKMLTLRMYRDGAKSRHLFDKDGTYLPENAATMRRAIEWGGLDPIGQSWMADLGTIAAEPGRGAGKSIPARVLGEVAGLVGGDNANQAVRRGIDSAGKFWHQTLLWDRIADLQMGIYVNAERQKLEAGFSPKAAAVYAGHLANRYAGALPKESMSQQAHALANLFFFSRSFTFGNLGAMKDTLTGLPKDQQALLGAELDKLTADATRTAARRKAMAAMMIDMGLFYAMNAALQTGIGVMTRDKTLDDEAKGFVRRAQTLAKRVSEHPVDILNPFDLVENLMPQGENEPGKRDRFMVGLDSQGRGLYGRNIVGKIGEEMVGWMTKPLEMLKRKGSTFVTPLREGIEGKDYFGREIYDKDDPTMTGMLKNAGRFVGHFMQAQVPTREVTGVYRYATGEGSGLDLAKAVLPFFTGVTLSSGYPGGPREGEKHAIEEKRRQAIFNESSDIRRMIQNNDIDKARERLRALGKDDRETESFIRDVLQPERKAARSEKRVQKLDRRGALTDDQRDRLEHVTQ